MNLRRLKREEGKRGKRTGSSCSLPFEQVARVTSTVQLRLDARYRRTSELCRKVGFGKEARRAQDASRSDGDAPFLSQRGKL